MSEVTVESFNKFMSSINKNLYRSRFIRPQISFNDDLVMSIQASHFHYSIPREDNLVEYTHWEVGFPTKKEDLLMPYIETSIDDPTGSVYPYVPVEVLVDIANKYGGEMKVSI